MITRFKGRQLSKHVHRSASSAVAGNSLSFFATGRFQRKLQPGQDVPAQHEWVATGLVAAFDSTASIGTGTPEPGWLGVASSELREFGSANTRLIAARAAFINRRFISASFETVLWTFRRTISRGTPAPGKILSGGRRRSEFPFHRHNHPGISGRLDIFVE